MSEPAGRANHKHGAVAFLATQWRVLIGARPFTSGVMVPAIRKVHQ